MNDSPTLFAQMLAALESGTTLPVPFPEMTPAEVIDSFPELRTIEVEELELPSAAADGALLPARHYRPPTQTTEQALVWIHGGAFIGGSYDMPEAHWVGLWLARHGVPVLTLSYRKALHGLHFPTMNEDILGAWAWANDNMDRLGASALHLGGASAGGALSSSVTQYALDGAVPQPTSLMLAYPVAHAVLPEPSDELTQALAGFDGLRFPPDTTPEIALNYLGSESELTNYLAFAGLRPALFPPTIIRNAECDDLRSSGERFAEDLAAAGTRVDIAFEPQSAHGYLNEPGNPSAMATLTSFREWITAHG